MPAKIVYPIILKKKYQLNSHILYRPVQDVISKKIQVLDTDKGEFFEIEGMAADMFLTFEKPVIAFISLEKIYGSAPSKDIINSAVKFVKYLAQIKLIKVVK
jgi:hypothetical protein